MNIYRAVFNTKADADTYLLSLGVLVLNEEDIVFAPTTAAVVYIGKVVDKDQTTDPENPVYYPGYAVDVMSSVDGLDFGDYAVYPGDMSAHSFFGYPKNAEVPPTE